MEIKTAISLIQKGIIGESRQRWADLGAGTGTFTQALASLLKEGSIIHAIDKDPAALKQIPFTDRCEIVKLSGDLRHVVSTLTPLDGILMANALHYIQDQEGLILNLGKYLVPGGRMIVVEYDTDTSNTWIPFPLSFESLRARVMKTSFSSIVRIGETPSRYQKGGIYAAVMM